MRLLLDECLSQRVAEELRRRGYDVASVIELGRREVSDADQFVFAAAERRTFVTYNVVHFVALVAEWFAAGRTHYGVLLVKQATIRREDIGGLVRALAAVLDTHPGDEDFLNGCDFLQAVP